MTVHMHLSYPRPTPLLLDLFCGAGGAAKGYQRAGFRVVGVDLVPQPNYCGDDFIQMDALECLRLLLAGKKVAGYRLEDFAAIHASPPCQAHTVYGNNRKHVRDDHPELIAPTRELLQEVGMPWVIENVEGARKVMRDPVRYCGTSFPPLEVRRHRLFESNVVLEAPDCNHGRLTERKYPGSTNRPNGRTVCNIGEYRVPIEQQRAAIDIDWMKLPELAQAIPPAYTEHIGRQLLRAVVP